jgi:uncharacterized protein (TIGR02145 family)
MYDWIKAGKNKQPAWCYYDFDPFEGSKYGKLYNWYAVNDARGIAPKGWHIPSHNEWVTLKNYIGWYAGLKMKSQIGWDYYRQGINTHPFAGLPGGSIDINDFQKIGSKGCWWSSTENKSAIEEAGYCCLYSYSDDVHFDDGPKMQGFSIRCIKD